MNYDIIFQSLISSTPKKTINEMKHIQLLDDLMLLEYGSNDIEGFQIFTPNHIVQDMIKSIGISKVANFKTTILEPTSGDGAFTVRIMEKRLLKISKENFLDDVLKALSTLYSIEMDRDLVRKQRSNVYTLIVNDGKNKKVNLDENWLGVLKIMILLNFNWAMFNYDNEITFLMPEIAYSMPEAENGKYKPITLPVWDIRDNEIHYKYEDVEV